MLDIYLFFVTLILIILVKMLFKSMLEDNSNDESPAEQQCIKYYGEITVIQITLKSKISEFDKYCFIKYFDEKFAPDQCYVNNFGEIYLIFYKAYLNTDRINIETSKMLHIMNVSILGFNDKKMLMGYLSNCVILSCQRFLDNYYNPECDNPEQCSEPSTPKSASQHSGESFAESSHRLDSKQYSSDKISNDTACNPELFETPTGRNYESSDSELSQSLENYYIFPSTINNLLKFSKETGLDVNDYSNIWGTWMKNDCDGNLTSFPGFPINQDTCDSVHKFIMSSYKEDARKGSALLNCNYKDWYESYGAILKKEKNYISEDSSCEEEYVKL